MLYSASMQTTKDRWLTRAEAARRAGISERTLDRWLNNGTLTRHRRGRAVKVRADELDRVLEPVPVVNR